MVIGGITQITSLVAFLLVRSLLCSGATQLLWLSRGIFLPPNKQVFEEFSSLSTTSSFLENLSTYFMISSILRTLGSIVYHKPRLLSTYSSKFFILTITFFHKLKFNHYNNFICMLCPLIPLALIQLYYRINNLTIHRNHSD